MKRTRIFSIFSLAIFVFAMLSVTTYASKTNLLAVSETEHGHVGSVVPLNLEVLPGSGRILINTAPLTRPDTQISFRIATQIACEEANVDCSTLDFIYTLDSSSPLVSGPSAGAAISALAYSELKGYHINENYAMTGTINAGGIIGPVDGIREKVSAASRANISLVLVPQIEFSSSLNLNKSLTENLSSENSDNENIEEFGASIGVRVVRVSTLYEALSYLTSEFKYETPEILRNAAYSAIMKNISEELCAETLQLLNTSRVYNLSQDYLLALNLSQKAMLDYSKGSYYSSASRCFGANLKLRGLIASSEAPYSAEEVLIRFDSVLSAIRSERQSLPKSYESLEELQAFMVTSSRLEEASKYLDDARINIVEKNYTGAMLSITSAEERLKSAILWKKLFNLPGKKLSLSEQKLKNACIAKIVEAQESYQYANFILPDYLNSTREKIISALSSLNSSYYADCFYQAALGKSEADSVILLSSMEGENLTPFLAARLNASEREISIQQKEGIFPLISFSYYDYSLSLKEDSPSASMLYAGYALELSKLSQYFLSDKKVPRQIIHSLLLVILIFIAGVSSGLLLFLAFSSFRRRRFRKALQFSKGEAFKKTPKHKGKFLRIR
ncbi:MAG: S16 family serine protease [Candidatus Woesearchaeota archaeon]